MIKRSKSRTLGPRSLLDRREFCLTTAKAAGLALLTPGMISAGRAAGPPLAGTGRFLLVHTNDVHDHVRPGFGGMGGLPYISGYIRSIRDGRDDVLVIDAGDVAEKGDLAAFLSHSTLTYRAMGRIGYDAMAIGNHEHNLARDLPPVGWDHVDKLHEFNALSGDACLALNLIDRDGNPLFSPSRIFGINGVRVGVIGMVLPREEGTLDFDASGRELAREAARLRDEAHIVVVTCHVGVNDSARWSEMAPDVDVFVSGHSHEVIHDPVVVEETGAIIVQAGSNALWVGRLELEVDLEKGGVIGHRGKLTFMCHDTIPVDEEMLAWLKEEEDRLYPGLDEIVAHLEKPVGWFGIARLAAEALRTKGGADLGFCHPTHVVRNSLPPGEIDVNTLFRTSADRGHPLVRTELTGAEVRAYLNGLAVREYRAWGQTQWAGFSVQTRSAGGSMTVTHEPDLDPNRRYRVIMPEREWEKRFLRLVEELGAADGDSPLARRRFTAEDAGFSFIDALMAYVRTVEAGGSTVHKRLRALKKAQGGFDPWEEQLEPVFESRVEPKSQVAGAGPRTAR